VTGNLLYYRDNLDILRRYIKDESDGPQQLPLED
jgi:hypothetical protein